MVEGACGHTYGCHEIWQFARDGDRWTDDRWSDTVRGTWQSALDLPGATQMRHLKSLALSRPRVTPCPALLKRPGSPGHEAVAGISDEATCAIIYCPVCPNARFLTLDLAPLDGPAKLWRYNPRTGHADDLGDVAGTCELPPPDDGPDSVWVLDTVPRMPPGL